LAVFRMAAAPDLGDDLALLRLLRLIAREGAERHGALGRPYRDPAVGGERAGAGKGRVPDGVGGAAFADEPDALGLAAGDQPAREQEVHGRRMADLVGELHGAAAR